MRTRLPIPANWQDFEWICRELWKEIWGDPNAQLNARTGFPQWGVDVFGRPRYSQSYAGVQCKDRDGNLGSYLGIPEFVDQCGAARSFEPELEVFTLATTAGRDPDLQLKARNLNIDRVFPFEVHVWSWDDIQCEIASRPILAKSLWGDEIVVDPNQDVLVSTTNPVDQFNAFFSRPAMKELVGQRLARRVKNVAYEICDNAFAHGNARQVRLSLNGSAFSISYDGAAFDPLSQLDPSKATASSHIGSLALANFRKLYGEDVELSYAHESQGASNRSVLKFEFLRPNMISDENRTAHIYTDLGRLFSRTGGRQTALALEIPAGISALVVTLPLDSFWSALSEFIRTLRDRVPQSVRLIISYPRGDDFEGLIHLFKDTGVEFEPR